METEIWKDIKGYEGLYQVSNLGRIKSMGNNRTRKEKIIKQIKSRSGYLTVNLCENGISTSTTVRGLVALHFIEGYKEGLVINHIDEDKTNNRASNLKWVTLKQSNTHGAGMKRRVISISKPVIQYDKEGKKTARFNSMNEASIKTGVNQGNISKCCKGDKSCPHAGGFIWKYEQ